MVPHEGRRLRGGRSDRGPLRLHHVPNWLLPQSWIEEQAIELGGRDTPLFLGKVLGQFSRAAGDEVVIPYDLLLEALQHKPEPGIGPRMGVDIARTRDRCVATLAFDGVKVAQKIWKPAGWDKAALMTVAGTIVKLARDWGRMLHEKGYAWDGSPIPGPACSIDATGLGAGVGDRLWQIDYRCDRVNFGPPAEKHFVHFDAGLYFGTERARLHWCVRRGLQEHVFQIPKKWSASWQEAQWAHCGTKPCKQGTEFWVEPKDSIVKRHKRSPDVWDADMLALGRETAYETEVFSTVETSAPGRHRGSKFPRGRRR